MNVDTKLISKVLAEGLKKVLPSLISKTQTASVKGRFISEGGRLLSDILEIADNLKTKVFLMTLDTEKGFDSVNHLFLITALEKHGFKEHFNKWIQILIQNQESCIINGGTTTNYFKVERGTRQCDPFSAYLLILNLEIPFLFIMQNENIDGLNIFETTFLCTVYADGTTFLINDEKSVIGLMKTFDTFSTLSGLKPNKSKWEIAGSGALKAVKLALCGIECVDLLFNAIKILGVYYSYEKNLENQERFINLVLKVEKILTLWRMQNLSIAGKITAFKIVHLALVKVIPNLIIAELEKINKHFIWKNGNPRIKQDTLCKGYENGGLKNVNITFKIISLQYSWVRRLSYN